MRKNVKNEKVIRAMAIGISAMLMASSPLTALAANGEEGTVPDDEKRYVDKKSEGVCDAAQAAADATDDAVERAEGKADKVKKDVQDNVKAADGENPGEAGTDKDGNDLAQAVIDAAAKVENNTVEDGSSLNDAQTDVYNAGIQLDDAEANDELYDAALKEAETQAGEAGTIASEMKDAMDEANKEVDVQLENIENATSIEDANAAYDKLEETANQAKADFDEKLADYNDAKTSYDKAVEDIAKYEKAYNDAVASASDNAAAAKAELDAAKANAAALEVAVTAAKVAVDESAKDAMKIADMEDLTQNDSGLNWRNEDKLFIAIMENYYLPEKLGIAGAEVTRVQGKDNNDYNYFTAVYTDENGEQQTKYFNFKMDGDSKDNIVIFEKREIEVSGGYVSVDETEEGTAGVELTQEELDAGLKDGSIVQTEDGKYVIKGEESEGPSILVKEEKTSTGKEDVLIDESSKQESYQLDDEGNLVKTVKADVTTITYTDATFTSDQKYATDAERDAAAEAKEKELEKTTGKDATIEETKETTYTYTANGTYIPTFTKTVNVKKEVEWKHTDKWNDAGVKTEAEAVAQVEKDAEKDLINDIQEDKDLYFLGNVQSNLAVTGHTEDKWYDDSDFIVTGTVSATYANVTKQTVDQSTFGALWDDIKSLFGGESTNEKLEAAAKKAIEADGGIFLSADWKDWKKDKATIRYVAGVKVTTDEKQTADAAKGAVEDAALSQAKANGATGVYNVKTTGTDEIANTTYSYKIDYLKEDTKTTETKAIETETFTNAEELTDNVTQNLNYLRGIILLTQNDTDYRDFVDSAKDLTAKYDRLLQEAKDANEAVAKAEGEVEELIKAIAALENKNSESALAELKAKLVIAEKDRDAAKDTLDDILDKLEQAVTELDDAIERLTPAPTPGAPTGGDEDTDDGDTTVTPPVVLATAPTTPVNVVTPVQAAQPGVVEIEDDVTPLAPSVEENVQEEVTQGETEAEEPETEETIQIDDEVSPLADIVVEDEQTKMSWWWLLIVLLLGTTGYEMYKKHNEKKQKVQAENAEDAE